MSWIDDSQSNSEWFPSKAVGCAKLHFLLRVDNDRDPTLTKNTEAHWFCDSKIYVVKWFFFPIFSPPSVQLWNSGANICIEKYNAGGNRSNWQDSKHLKPPINWRNLKDATREK